LPVGPLFLRQAFIWKTLLDPPLGLEQDGDRAATGKPARPGD
jgi:hypothetical protein